jgi:hypothetical protein
MVVAMQSASPKRASKQQPQDAATAVAAETVETVLLVDPEDSIPPPEVRAEAEALYRYRRARVTQATSVPLSAQPTHTAQTTNNEYVIPPRVSKNTLTRKKPVPPSGKPIRAQQQQQQKQKPLPTTEDLPKPLRVQLLSRRAILFGGGSMLGMFAAIQGIQAACRAIQSNQEHYQYGDALVYRLNADVGHGGVSQFTSFVSMGCIVVVEVVGSNPARVSTYNPDKQPHLVRLKVAQVNLHGIPGKPDLLSATGKSGWNRECVLRALQHRLRLPGNPTICILIRPNERKEQTAHV